MRWRSLFMLFLGVFLMSSAAWADDFYVIAVGRGVGTRITSLPYTITQPGFYYLGGNLTTSGNGILVDCSDVTIDLMGFKITGPGSSGYGIAIAGTVPLYNVEIRNGTITGFLDGISAFYSGTSSNHKIINVRAVANSRDGISLGPGNIIKGCQLFWNGQYGLQCFNSLVMHNVALANGTKNLVATSSTVVDNHAP